MPKVDRTALFPFATSGLAVGLLGVIAMFASWPLPFTPRQWFDVSQFVGPALLGALLVDAVHSKRKVEHWRAVLIIAGVVGAHWFAFKHGVGGVVARGFEAVTIVFVGSFQSEGPAEISDILICFASFLYRVTFAFLTVVLAGALFSFSHKKRIFVLTIPAAGVIAWSYWPLSWVEPSVGGLFISYTAAWLTFGLVFAVVAAIVGPRLLDSVLDRNLS